MTTHNDATTPAEFSHLSDRKLHALKAKLMANGLDASWPEARLRALADELRRRAAGHATHAAEMETYHRLTPTLVTGGGELVTRGGKP